MMFKIEVQMVSGKPQASITKVVRPKRKKSAQATKYENFYRKLFKTKGLGK